VIEEPDRLWELGVSVFERYNAPYTEEMKPFVEVMLHKRVVVKQKQITIPVMHEEVRIERVPVDATAARPSTEGTFVESTVAIPLHDEEVEIRKRAVVREEIRVTKQTFQEEKTATTEVRREEIDIEEPKASKGYLHPPAH